MRAFLKEKREGFKEKKKKESIKNEINDSRFFICSTEYKSSLLGLLLTYSSQRIVKKKGVGAMFLSHLMSNDMQKLMCTTLSVYLSKLFTSSSTILTQ